MLKLHSIIERHWQTPHWMLTILLWPLSRLFKFIYCIRRQAYQRGFLKQTAISVPVVVVGNIHAGGTGKTPIVAALLRQLQQQNINVGVISRGYGRHNLQTHVLTPSSRAEEVGDEPLMLYQQTHAPTAVARYRVDAAKALLAKHPQVELIISDDGLQHYALQRNIEITVFPVMDINRNLDFLPNGNLREPLSRLDDVDAIVFTGCKQPVSIKDFPSSASLFSSYLLPKKIYRLNHQDVLLNINELTNKKVAAIAGIAKPERFFKSLQQIGIHLAACHILPDHANIAPDALPNADIVIITEKDAVKLAGIDAAHVWVLPVCAIIEPNLGQWLIQQLKVKNLIS